VIAPTIAYKASSVRLKLLNAFKKRPKKFVTTVSLKMESGLSEKKLMETLKKMKAMGYKFKFSPRKGFYLNSQPDFLLPEAILCGLSTQKIGKFVYGYQKLGSTNDRALFLGERGAREGTIVTTDEQTQGRGRRGRNWHSVSGKSLTFSLILRPNLLPDEVAELTLASAVAVVLTLQEWKLKAGIKWPNDIFLGKRKVCGILNETRFKQDKIAFAVIGIGINLNQTIDDFPSEIKGTATSVFRYSGKKINRVLFLQRLLLCLENVLHWIDQRQFHRVLTEWRRQSVLLNRQIRILQPGRVFFGQALDVDEQGALLVRNDFGMIERVLAGDVELLRISNRRLGHGKKSRRSFHDLGN
jgi:BirA family biotin operon repressor/biotin-[acetyl-CoA-carboxylase] ligase